MTPKEFIQKWKRSVSVMSVLVLFAALGCTRERYQCKLHYELRRPVSNPVAEGFHADLVTEQSMSGRWLSSNDLEIEGGYFVVRLDALLFEERRRSIVVDEEGKGRPAEVFELPLLERPSPRDWTDWLLPSFTEKTPNAEWNVLHDQFHQFRSKEVPRDSFELRYRVDSCRTW